MCQNSTAPLGAYVSCLDNRVVPLLVSAHMDKDMLNDLIIKYHPEYLWIPNELITQFQYPSIYTNMNYSLLKTEFSCFPLYEDLSLLLTTSGSTGSAKFVRHSYTNVIANAKI